VIYERGDVIDFLRPLRGHHRLALVAAVAIVLASVLAIAARAGFDPSEFRPNLEPDAAVVDRAIPGNQSPAHVSASHVPRPAPLAVAGATGAGTNFNGIDFHQERFLTDGGNQFSVEPPDQGLCVGNGYVIEAINTSFAVYNTAGHKVSPAATSGTSQFQSLNQLFTGDHAIVRPAGSGPRGAFISDPKCYYDAASQRFFFTILTIATDPATGAFATGAAAHTDIRVAVSDSNVPTANPADWTVTTIDTTNNGANGTPSHPGCPCLGDQPLLGADANGIYLTTNEFSLFGSGFNGAQVYAIQKSALVAGRAPHVQRIEGAPLASSYGDGIPYSLQPAISPDATFATGSNGTEYLLGALEFGKNVSNLDNRIAVWALTNTQSLNSRQPAVALDDSVIQSQVYGLPGAIVQPNGPTPLADSLKEHEDLLDGGDDRMQVAVYAHGLLWGAGDTVVKTPSGSSQVGVTYYVVNPSVSGSTVSGSVIKQGYLSVDNASVTRPSLAVTSAGRAVIGVSLIGDGHFPSAAYASLDDSLTSAGPSTLKVIAEGVAPSDGFSGYHAFGADGVARWGDYGAAQADGSSIWVANEWIDHAGNGSDLANWGTYVTQVTP
jgi:hypothetical protein